MQIHNFVSGRTGRGRSCGTGSGNSVSAGHNRRPGCTPGIWMNPAAPVQLGPPRHPGRLSAAVRGAQRGRLPCPASCRQERRSEPGGQWKACPPASDRAAPAAPASAISAAWAPRRLPYLGGMSGCWLASTSWGCLSLLLAEHVTARAALLDGAARAALLCCCTASRAQRGAARPLASVAIAERWPIQRLLPLQSKQDVSAHSHSHAIAACIIGIGWTGLLPGAFPGAS